MRDQVSQMILKAEIIDINSLFFNLSQNRETMSSTMDGT